MSDDNPIAGKQFIHENLSKLVIPAFYIAAMTLLVITAWNNQKTARQGGDSPIYRNLTDSPAYIRRGFDQNSIDTLICAARINDTADFMNVLDGSAEWLRFESWPLRVRDSALPDLPKRAFLSPYGKDEEEFTLLIPVEVDGNAITFLGENPSVLPGIYFSVIGENWEVFLNGTSVRSEMHPDESGNIRERRTWWDVYFAMDRSLIVPGTNILSLRIVGDPTHSYTGLAYLTHYLDDFNAIEGLQRDILLVFLCGIFGFTGVYYLMIFLSVRNRREVFYLYFSLFSFLLCAYTFARQNMLINNVIPNSDISKRLENASLTLMIPAFCLFIETIGRGKITKITKGYLAFCFLLTMTEIFSCPQYSVETSLVWNISVFIYYSYVFFYDVIYFYFFDRSGPGIGRLADLDVPSSNIIAGASLIYICGIYEIVNVIFYFNIINLFQYSTFAVQIGMVFTLSQRFSGMYRQLEQSNVILETMVRERTLELEKQTAIAVQASFSKSAFLASMSHEMKTPLTVISVHVQRAKELFEDSALNAEGEMIRDSLIRAQEEIMRTARMTENALRFASMSEGRTLDETRYQMKSMDITALLKTVAEAYRVLLEKRGNKLTINIPDKLPQVYGSADLLIQVMANLLSNANAHTSNGVIGMSAELKSEKAEDGESDFQFILVSLADTGSGISPELLPHMFERHIEGASGTGIGLSICKEIIASHGGRIGIDSKAGEWTRVFFSIPVIDE